ncbi:MAG: gamma carbonic anhydrase family protein [Planctomycetota bacterium]|jgi:carbonic anhydrase/acetyltransferase-like protein (isoleucine patch superfamily)
MGAELPEVPRRPEGLMRRLDSGAMVAEGAMVIGDVTLAEDVSIWFGCVVRGDDAPITIGARTNVQDGTVIHCDTGCPQVIGRDCTIGHRAMLHGVHIGDDVLIGMSATVLGGARIGDGAVVAAGALVKENFEVPPRTLVAGVPARVVREVSEKELAFMRHAIPHYVETARSYL